MVIDKADVLLCGIDVADSTEQPKVDRKWRDLAGSSFLSRIYELFHAVS